ncbi:MAG: glycosyltransferase family 9 protein [Myxococcota bacterium]
MPPIPLFATPPANVCLLRLSALGDVCHAIALLRVLQRAWPETRFSWIVGKSEARMLALVDGVEVIPFDKGGGIAALRELGSRLGARRFDLLLMLQVALRASLLSALIPARVKLGFDRARAREGQWLFSNARIAPREREHVLDAVLGFGAACGVTDLAPRWDLALPESARAYAARLIPDGAPSALVISPCSSVHARDWLPQRYAALADYAHARHGLRVILCGGASDEERAMGEAIERAAGVPLQNQIGRDTLPELIALLARAAALVCPDSGPAHFATMTGTPVIGLHATSNPARSGAYFSRAHCVNRFPDAARKFRGMAVEELPWADRIEQPGVMALISLEDVTARLDALLGSRA